MKKSFVTLFGALALSAGSAAAAVITGSLGYTSLSGFSANNSDLTLATTITQLGMAQVSGTVDGTFAAEGIMSGDILSLPANPLLVNSLLALPANAIWSIDQFTFTLTSISELPGNVSTALGLSGVGTISHPDYESATGKWVATFNREGTNFTFSSSTSTTSVPEGGTALALLGLGLLGLEGARRKLKTLKA